MKTIAVVLVLACLLADSHSAHQSADLKAALDFIGCTQKAIITGIPEAGIPSHDPLKFDSNATYDFPLGSFFDVTVHLNNMEMDGIPYWNVTEALQIVSDDPNVEIFMFTVYWPMISFSVDWEIDYQALLDHGEANGTLYVELDHLNFYIGWTSTKPESGKNGTLDAFSLDVDVKESQVNVTNLGDLGDFLNAIGGEAVKFFVNNNLASDDLSEQLKTKLITDWVEKPEKIDAVNTFCEN